MFFLPNLRERHRIGVSCTMELSGCHGCLEFGCCEVSEVFFPGPKIFVGGRRCVP
jgi:hypothetical protein